ncbi:potassium channel family protein [Coprobacter tertius]|uniref:Potassium channel family protein n=1 Tax=Coprobacter tertius TaxID=2944915 RepID=A0ABT1MEA4_9BACT|nr:potassium channel family protein [Coprobacter tertius]MCP9610953.1 potassium channel family protein [Coprobacter tertius]
MKSALSDFIYEKKGIYGFLHVVILILSLFLIISISIDTFNNISFLTQPAYLKVQLYICLFFIFDFILEFFLSHNKWYYLRTHFVFLIISIPYVNIIDYYHITFSPEITYFLRFIPLVRGGYALAIVVSWLTYTKASSLFVSYLTMLMATVYFSSLIFFVLEHKVNPEVNGYADALWWAFMDVTTVGSNIYAVTVTGRVLSVVLAALGMMMFPIFTVYITSVVQDANKKREEFYKNNTEKQKMMKTGSAAVAVSEKVSGGEDVNGAE